MDSVRLPEAPAGSPTFRSLFSSHFVFDPDLSAEELRGFSRTVREKPRSSSAERTGSNTKCEENSDRKVRLPAGGSGRRAASIDSGAFKLPLPPLMVRRTVPILRVRPKSDVHIPFALRSDWKLLLFLLDFYGYRHVNRMVIQNLTKRKV